MKVSFLIAELQRMQRLSGKEDLEVKILQHDDGWHDLVSDVRIQSAWEEDDMGSAVVLSSRDPCTHGPLSICPECPGGPSILGGT